MKKMLKKLAALVVMATIIFNVSLETMAATQDTFIDPIDGKTYKKLPEISEQDFEKALEKAIQIEKLKHYKNTQDINQAVELERELTNALLRQEVIGNSKSLMNRALQEPISLVVVPEEGGGSGDTLLKPKDSWIPNLHIKNTYVAAALNTLINATLIAIGVGSVSVALKSYGKTQLRKMFSASIKTKVLGKGALALGGSIYLLVDFIFNIVSPGAKIAEWLDSIDHDKNNGYLDIIW